MEFEGNFAQQLRDQVAHFRRLIEMTEPELKKVTEEYNKLLNNKRSLVSAISAIESLLPFEPFAK